MRVWRLPVLAVLVGVALGGTADCASAQSDRLSGLWSIRFSGSTAHDTVLVALSLTPVSAQLRHRWMALNEPSHKGVISEGTSRLGAFPPGDPLDLIVLARIVGDSVVIVTHPSWDHGGLQLVGVLDGDRILGRWLVRNRMLSHQGQFEMVPWQLR